MKAEPLTREKWLQNNGFAQDPFMRFAYFAERDPLREKCFEEFPYYSEIKGTISSPGPVLICAQRGGGKSALRCQIALELSVSLKSSTEHYLVVDYQDFEQLANGIEGDLTRINLRAHIEHIVGLIVARLFDLSLERDSGIDFRKLTVDQKWLLYWYITNFAKHLHYREINKRLGKLFGLAYYVNAENVVRVLLDLLKTIPSAKDSLGSITEILTTWPVHPADANDISSRDLLLDLIQICKTCGVDSVYVLIDMLDSIEHATQDDFQSAVQIVRPLCSTAALFLHNTPGLIVKIFAPEEIWTLLESQFRHELGVRHIEWQPGYAEDVSPLLRVWRKRLAVCSNHTFASLTPLVEEHIDIDDWIVKAARTPRELLFLGNAMLDHHFRYPSDIPLLTLADWDAAYHDLARFRENEKKSIHKKTDDAAQKCEHLKELLQWNEKVLHIYQVQTANLTPLTIPADLQSNLQEKQREVDGLKREIHDLCEEKRKEREDDK